MNSALNKSSEVGQYLHQGRQPSKKNYGMIVLWNVCNCLESEKSEAATVMFYRNLGVTPVQVLPPLPSHQILSFNLKRTPDFSSLVPRHPYVCAQVVKYLTCILGQSAMPATNFLPSITSAQGSQQELSGAIAHLVVGVEGETGFAVHDDFCNPQQKILSIRHQNERCLHHAFVQNPVQD